jgi:hypothetical protein
MRDRAAPAIWLMLAATASIFATSALFSRDATQRRAAERRDAIRLSI